jgi:hypothetical protein
VSLRLLVLVAEKGGRKRLEEIIGLDHLTRESS